MTFDRLWRAQELLYPFFRVLLTHDRVSDFLDFGYFTRNLCGLTSGSRSVPPRVGSNQ